MTMSVDSAQIANINLGFSIHEKEGKLFPKLEGTITSETKSENLNLLLKTMAEILSDGKLATMGMLPYCIYCPALQILSAEEKSTIVRKLYSDGEGKISLHCSLFDAFTISLMGKYKADTLGCSNGIDLSVVKDSPIMSHISSEKPTEPAAIMDGIKVSN